MISQELMYQISLRIDALTASGCLPLRAAQIGADHGYGLRMLATDAFGWEQPWAADFRYCSYRGR